MILEVIKETKRYGYTVGRSVGRTVGRTDNVKTVYLPTNTVCGGIIRKLPIQKPLSITKGNNSNSIGPIP